MDSALIVTFALAFTTILCVLQILYHLEEKIRYRCPKGEKFGISSGIESVIFDEYKIGFINGWECGHVFSVLCNVFSSEPKVIKRANINFYPRNDALSKNEVIGWGKNTDGYAEIHISIRPRNAKDLFQEFRNYSNGTLRLGGVITENQKIHITSISFSPQFDDSIHDGNYK